MLVTSKYEGDFISYNIEAKLYYWNIYIIVLTR